jgi:hypothetical protein
MRPSRGQPRSMRLRHNAVSIWRSHNGKWTFIVHLLSLRPVRKVPAFGLTRTGQYEPPGNRAGRHFHGASLLFQYPTLMAALASDYALCIQCVHVGLHQVLVRGHGAVFELPSKLHRREPAVNLAEYA